MRYRVKKSFGSSGTVRWYPQAKPSWWPFCWFYVDCKYDDQQTEVGAWNACKRHALGDADLDDWGVAIPFLMVLIGIPGFILYAILYRTGVIEWLKSLIF